MKRSVRRPRVLLAATLLLAASAAPARAQSLWMDREARTSVRVDMRIPSTPYDENGGYAAFLTVRAPVRRTAWAVVEAPFARLAASETFIPPDFGDFVTEDIRQSTLGNPYLGLEFARRVTGLHYEIGVRPPLARRSQGYALSSGFTSGVEYEQAFLDHTFSTRVGALYHRAAHAKSPIGYDIRLGATWQVPTTRPEIAFRYPTDDPFNAYSLAKPLDQRHALYVEHAADVRLEGAHAYLGIGWNGRWLANNSSGNFGSNSVEELSFAVEILRGPIHPGMAVVVALDEDLKSSVDGAFGLSLSTGAGRRNRWLRAE
jgi:hypothetical protein